MASALSEDSLPPRNSSQQSPVSPAIVGDDLSNSGLLDAADKESSIKAVSVCARPPARGDEDDADLPRAHTHSASNANASSTSDSVSSNAKHSKSR